MDYQKSNSITPPLGIYSKLCNKNTAIFCGAGISFNSGIPLVHDFVTKVLEYLDVPDMDIKKILDSNLPFESFIESLMEETDINEILDIFSCGSPNTTHFFIARLIKLGLVKTILTTNFDTLLEEALNADGLQRDIGYKVYSTEKDFYDLNWDDNTIKVIKIHGCSTDKENMAITMAMVAKKMNMTYKNKVISSFFSKMINSEILVLGYSCSDLFDISPVIESLTKDTSRITFIDHTISLNNKEIEHISIQKYKNPFKNFEGDRIRINTDILIKDLWEKIIPTSYNYIENTIPWLSNVERWMNCTIKYSAAMKNHLSAKLFYGIGNFKLAADLWRNGLTIARQENNKTFYYSQLGNIGMTLNSLGAYDEAMLCLEESIKECSNLNNTQGIVSQLQALGNVYSNLLRISDAIKVYQDAVSIAEKHMSSSLCPSLGNLATAYNQNEEYDKAIECLKRGISLARSTGNTQSEGSMLASFGIAYMKKGDNKLALEYFNDSLKLTQNIGDRRGECLTLQNLSALYLNTKSFNESINYANLVLTISSELGLELSKSAAYFNKGVSFAHLGIKTKSIMNLKKSFYIYKENLGINHPYTNTVKAALDTMRQNT